MVVFVFYFFVVEIDMSKFAAVFFACGQEGFFPLVEFAAYYDSAREGLSEKLTQNNSWTPVVPRHLAGLRNGSRRCLRLLCGWTLRRAALRVFRRLHIRTFASDIKTVLAAGRQAWHSNC